MRALSRREARAVSCTMSRGAASGAFVKSGVTSGSGVTALRLPVDADFDTVGVDEAVVPPGASCWDRGTGECSGGTGLVWVIETAEANGAERRDRGLLPARAKRPGASGSRRTR